MLNFLIFSLFFIGVCFIVYSVIKFKPAESQSTQPPSEETLEKLEAATADADHALEELSKLSQNIFDEITAKYKELLYLYQLIEQKQGGMHDSTLVQSHTLNHSHHIKPVAPTSTSTEQEQQNFMAVFNSTNLKHNEIQQLYKKGMSISDIAKALNIGQGEVSLVIQMGKGD
jgi:hypothetical protein